MQKGGSGALKSRMMKTYSAYGGAQASYTEDILNKLTCSLFAPVPNSSRATLSGGL